MSNTITVTATFERWVQDLAEEKGISYDALSQELADECETSRIWISRIIGKPEIAKISHLLAFARVLGVSDWYAELYEGWGMASETALGIELNRALQLDGDRLGRVQCAA